MPKRLLYVPLFSLSIFRHILFFLSKIGSLLYHLSPNSLYCEYFFIFLKIGCALFSSYVPLFSINIVSPFLNFTTPINNLSNIQLKDSLKFLFSLLRKLLFLPKNWLLSCPSSHLSFYFSLSILSPLSCKFVSWYRISLHIYIL